MICSRLLARLSWRSIFVFMPHRPPHPCAVSGCPAVVTRGARCPEHLRALQREADSFRPSAARRGYGHAWRRIRLAHLRREPLCRFCGERGRTVAAAEVDHVVALADGGTHVASNLRSLCTPCHSSRTARDQGFARPRRRSVLR